MTDAVQAGEWFDCQAPESSPPYVIRGSAGYTMASLPGRSPRSYFLFRRSEGFARLVNRSDEGHVYIVPMRPASIGLLCVALAGSSATRVADAEESEERIRLTYEAPSDCPGEAVFLAQVRARTRRIRRAADGERARTFWISIARGEKQTAGHLRIREPGGWQSDREVAGDTCEEVVAALALVASLAVDPNAETGDVAAAPPAGSESPVPSRSSIPTEAPALPALTSNGAPLPAPSAPPSIPARPAGGSPTPQPREQPARPMASRWHFAVGLAAAFVAGVSPNGVASVPVWAEAAGPRNGLFTPTVRAGFERATSGTISLRGPTATLTWTVAVLEGCPARWTFGAVAFEPCVRAEAGVLEGAGANIVPAREQKRAWVALGPVARVQWSVVGPLFVDFEAGLRAPLVRTRYFFEPNTTVYQPPPVAGVVAGGLGVRFL
jgi:hypothetical protein